MVSTVGDDRLSKGQVKRLGLKPGQAIWPVGECIGQDRSHIAP